jgi:Cation efflux family
MAQPFTRRPPLPLHSHADSKTYSLPNPFLLPSPPLTGQIPPKSFAHEHNSQTNSSILLPDDPTRYESIDSVAREADATMARRPKVRPRGESDLGKPAVNGAAVHLHHASNHHHNHAPYVQLRVKSFLRFLTVFRSPKTPSFVSNLFSHSKRHDHDHDHSHSHQHSKLTAVLISCTTPGSIIHSILIQRDSRRIAYFGCLNLVFMVVQFFYGFATGSLGLLTDSIHMLFDCLGLAVGLAAAVMGKWSPSLNFPYGYAKIETLSGFANGIFLM